jgi:hypothetical protein
MYLYEALMKKPEWNPHLELELYDGKANSIDFP